MIWITADERNKVADSIRDARDYITKLEKAIADDVEPQKVYGMMRHNLLMDVSRIFYRASMRNGGIRQHGVLTRYLTKEEVDAEENKT